MGASAPRKETEEALRNEGDVASPTTEHTTLTEEYI
jgi:hypothetical protein